MSKCEMVKLVDICDFQGGSQPPKEQWIEEAKDGYIRMLQIRDFTQNRDGKEEYIKISKNIKTCDDSDILIARYGASVGKILSGLSGAYNVAIMKTIPDAKKLNKKYLRMFLLSNVFQNYIANVGSRAAQAGFNKTDLENLSVQLPPLENQKQIAKTLDTAAELLAMRKQQLAELDNLIKSTFYDMFGDPVTNEKGWEVSTLGACCNLIKDGPHASPNYVEKGIPFVSVNNIIKGYWDLENVKHITREDYEKFSKRCKPEYGDVLYTKGGTTGYAKYVDRDFEFMNWVHIAVLKYKRQLLNGIFLENTLNCDYCYKQSQQYTRGIANRDLVLSQMSKIALFVPPLNLQTQFASIVTKIEEQKSLVKKAIDETQYLFDSLMSEYFE